MTANRTFFYGWIIIPVAWIIYGFGISPGYYSWGQFADAIIADLDINREQFGRVAGVFTFLYSAMGLVVGLLQPYLGLRVIITGGALMSAAGFLLLSQANSLMTCFIGYGLLGGAGIGLATIVPCQALATNWFFKYRARAIAIIFTAGGIVGMVVPRVDQWILENWTWQQGWLLIAGISGAVALVAAVFVRNTPEDVGQYRDGAESDPLAAKTAIGAPATGSVDDWSAAQAIRTPQFALIVLCGIAYAVPWGVVINHGRLHLGDQGFEPDFIAGVFGAMIVISIAGRFSGAVGDWIAPQRVLGFSLLLESIGVAGLLYTQTQTMAFIMFTLIGIGFGAAYISVPLVFAEYFGRRAFATTSGLRILITGIFNGIGPWFAGWTFEATNSYTIAFLTLAGLGIAGAIAAFLCPRPGLPPHLESSVQT